MIYSFVAPQKIQGLVAISQENWQKQFTPPKKYERNMTKK